MSEKFSLELNVSNGQALIGLVGQMDEDMDLTLAQNIKEPEVIFDFEKVSGINSCGIRDWITFVNEISEKNPGLKLIYKRCPQVIIEQMNMVKGFLPEGADIESFYAPFFCESCDNEQKILLKPADIVDKKAPSHLKCQNCGEEGLEFDALPAQYFHFLN